MCFPTFLFSRLRPKNTKRQKLTGRKHLNRHCPWTLYSIAIQPKFRVIGLASEAPPESLHSQYMLAFRSSLLEGTYSHNLNLPHSLAEDT